MNGSLTLGGYDTSRFIPNDVSIAFAPTQTRQLVVSLQSITYADSKTNDISLLSQGILALVDTTVPYMWLPQTACTLFEKAFGLTWDSIRNLYLVNSTLHSTLLKTNANVTFEISNSLTSGPAVNITLPYASFDLVVTPPLIANASRYFPLQRANDESSYTLGRAFFQEAYMFVDFDNQTFSISQANYDPKIPSHVIAVQSANTSNTTSPGPTGSGISKTTGNGSSGIGAGAIAGIVIAVVVIAVLLLGGWFFLRQRRRRRERALEAQAQPPMTEKPQAVEDDDDDDSSTPMAGSSTKPKESTTTNAQPGEPPMSPPLSEIGGEEARKPHELPGTIPNRSELGTPEPHQTPELGSSGDAMHLTTELSTPNHPWNNHELPTPPAAQEMPSPEHSVKSPVLAAKGSAASDSEGDQALDLPVQRPHSSRLDSSDSESGLGFHHMKNAKVETAIAVSPPRRPHHRKDSDESSISQLSPTSPSLPPVRRNGAKTTISPHRPKFNERINSNDSTTMETRMNLTSTRAQSPDIVSPTSTKGGSADNVLATSTGDEALQSSSEKVEGKKPAL